MVDGAGPTHRLTFCFCALSSGLFGAMELAADVSSESWGMYCKELKWGDPRAKFGRSKHLIGSC